MRNESVRSAECGRRSADAARVLPLYEEGDGDPFEGPPRFRVAPAGESVDDSASEGAAVGHAVHKLEGARRQRADHATGRHDRLRRGRT